MPVIQSFNSNSVVIQTIYSKFVLIRTLYSKFYVIQILCIRTYIVIRTHLYASPTSSTLNKINSTFLCLIHWDIGERTKPKPFDFPPLIWFLCVCFDVFICFVFRHRLDLVFTHVFWCFDLFCIWTQIRFGFYACVLMFCFVLYLDTD